MRYADSVISPPEHSFFGSGDVRSIWQRYCGFLDLSLEGFRQIQEHLLMEQVGLAAESALGKKLLEGHQPATVDELRSLVPLTSYQDYAPYFNGQHQQWLADTQYTWVHTSAPGGSFKRVPWASRFQKVQGRNIIAAMVLASAPAKEEVTVAPGAKVLLILPGKPFASASLASSLAQQFPARIAPPLNGDERMPFRSKIDTGLRMALTTDLDFVISMTSSLLRIGQRSDAMFKDGKLPLALSRLHPRVLWRVLRKRLGGRRHLTPKDIWSPKGVIGWGADSDVFQEKIEKHWGRPFYQMYASSEAGIIAMQESLRGPMAFLPDSVFLEFLPEAALEAGDRASTVLISEVQDGGLYEPVITSFYGMPFLRYRQGDLVRIQKGGDSRVPRMVFYGRADDVIDLFGIARLNTATVSRALELTGLDHGDWCLRKEYEECRSVLKLYVELNQETQAVEMERRFHSGLRAADQHYREAVYTMAYNPTRVVALPRGAFQRLAQGGNGYRHKRMNPPDSAVQQYLVQPIIWNDINTCA